MKSVIIGTAGHIDHGKSALVRVLTGKDPDRLPEEKRRGITIDLGFADLDLGEVRIGFVDVPGHEKFVKNMLAGAHGIDAVALVIAADEGVMPQTREHFAICRLLGIKTGLVVITKCDLVEKELLQLVEAEAQELVAGSFLEGAPIVSVSARTGQGMDELKQALMSVGLSVPEKSAAHVLRLPVDRVFTIKGFGAVVTGTLVSGEVKEGDELELLPPGRQVRARGIQVHGKAVTHARAGNRTAINLGGIDVGSIERGMVLATAGRLRPSQVLDVEVEMLREAPRALRSRSRVRLHLHAAEIMGRVKILNQTGEIEPGQRGFAQLRLESPVIATLGEHFILRSYSPAQTIAGGQVLEPFAHKHRGRDLNSVETRLNALLTSDKTIQVINFIIDAGDQGLRLSDLAARTAWNDRLLDEVTHKAVESGEVIKCEGVFLAQGDFQRLAEETLADVKSHHRREPLSRGLLRETLREQRFSHAAPEVFRTVLAQLERQDLLVSDKDVVRAREHQLQVRGADAELRDKLAEVYAVAKLEPPSLEKAFELSGIAKNQIEHGRKLLQLLLDNGVIVRVQGDLLFHRVALDELKAKLRQYGDDHEPARSIDVPTFKDLAGVSRKYAIPLLEYFDRERITRRAGDSRVISR